MPKHRTPGTSALDEVDMTKEEFDQIKDAFKKEEFRKMFADYANEINDPKNKAIYESEITQMEKDRGVDVTFVHPNPGYVIKTSADGKQKAFINVCCNENVGKPSFEPGSQDGSSGFNWSVPYIHAAPKVDIDKSRNRCLVYDVVFHPDSLRLAKKNSAFRKFVNDTALTAVEDNYSVKLDKTNLRVPKMQFKGAQQATVIRKKRADMSDVKDPDELFDIPNYPYEPLKENPVPLITKVNNEPSDVYTTPHYVLTHRKEVDMHEFSNALDSKMHAATPTELEVIVDLPLVKSALDMSLDVCERSLLLVTEAPAKYKLEVKLPWPVDEDAGSAKFDKSTKKLFITLPVKRYLSARVMDLSHEDSGVESDHNLPSIKSSSDEDTSDSFPSESVPLVEECTDKETMRTNTFLDPSAHYSFPNYTINPCGESIAAVLDVPNVDSSTLKHSLVNGNEAVCLSFASLGSGFFPVNYAFSIKSVKGEFDPCSVDIDISEDNVVLRLKVVSDGTTDSSNFLVGLTPESLTDKFIPQPLVSVDGSNKEPKCHMNNISAREVETVDKTDSSLTLVLRKLSLNEVDKSHDEVPTEKEKTVEEIVETTPNQEYNTLEESKVCDKGIDEFPRILVEGETQSEGAIHTVGDDERTLSEVLAKEETVSLESSLKEEEAMRTATKETKVKKRLSPKSRTLSECSSAEVVRRSILKSSRSLSESYADDYVWSSVDSSDSCIPEEMSVGIKKTVRFSDIISQKYFRANSSILGQRKKNQRKTRNKKKVHDRRASESEASASEAESEPPSDFSASDISDVSSDASSSELEDSAGGTSLKLSSHRPDPIPSSKSHHKRRGHKNKRKNAATDKQKAASWSDHS